LKRIRVISLAVIAALSLTVTSFAADSSPQQQSAAAYLREAGIMLGNESGDMMLEQGLTEETRRLLEEGVPETAQSMQAIGYRQTVLYLKGEWDKAAAVDKIKQATRNFAKRQFTWYKKMPYVKWFNLDAEPNYENVTAEMIKIVVEKFKIG